MAFYGYGVTMQNNLFFKSPSNKQITGKGPSQFEFLDSISKNNDWIVLNSSILRDSLISDKHDDRLNCSVNALKAYLQVNGPHWKKTANTPDCRGKGPIYHGHAYDKQNKHYILEWTVIDKEKRILMLIDFGVHENHAFTQKVCEDKKNKILNSEESRKIIKNVERVRKEAKQKLLRTQKGVTKKSITEKRPTLKR